MSLSIAKPSDAHLSSLDQLHLGSASPPAQGEDLSHFNPPEPDCYGVPADDDSDFDDDWDCSKEKTMPPYYRSVCENGQLIQKPALEYAIYLKDKPPEGCDKDSFYLRFLKKVTSDTDAAYVGVADIDDPMFFAILTEDEFESLSGMDEVANAEDTCMDGAQY